MPELDIKTEFGLFCGPDVLYSSHTKEGRTLRIWYTIPVLNDTAHRVADYLRNGLERRAVRQMADSAKRDAYHREERTNGNTGRSTASGS